MKVRASTLLTSIPIWEEIILAIRNKNPISDFERSIVLLYDLVEVKTGLSPFTILHRYDIVEGKTGFKGDDQDPIKVIEKLAYAYSFFEILDREYFLSKIRNYIDRELHYCCPLIQKRHTWKKDFRKMITRLNENDINVSYIINKKIEIDGYEQI